MFEIVFDALTDSAQTIPFLLIIYVGIELIEYKGAITYGSMIAGLCAASGLGLLVLFREEKDKKDVLRVLLLLFGISVSAGLVIQYIF